MLRVRTFLFWLHLAAGLAGGLIIAVLCLTGTALAFEKELTAWAERDVRRITVPADAATRLSIDELAAKLRAAFPEAKPGNIVIARDPHTAVAFSVSRTESYHGNPFTGEVRRSASTGMAEFMQRMLAWHRYLGFSGQDSRPRAKLVTGVANITFSFLALSGLVLWWPRSLSWRAFRPAIWFTQNTSGRARDWNWHNVLGFWCAPALIVLTLTALPISFRWAADLTYPLTGTPLPADGAPGGAQPPSSTVPPPGAKARAVSRDTLLATVQQARPAWETISFRFVYRPDPTKPQAATFTVRESGTWPRTATTTMQFDPFTGALLQVDGFTDLPAARQLRSWTRFLHTGEALGSIGQFIAAFATVGGAVLVYTGLALACRRFFGRARSADSRSG